MFAKQFEIISLRRAPHTPLCLQVINLIGRMVYSGTVISCGSRIDCQLLHPMSRKCFICKLAASDAKESKNKTKIKLYGFIHNSINKDDDVSFTNLMHFSDKNLIPTPKKHGPLNFSYLEVDYSSSSSKTHFLIAILLLINRAKISRISKLTP